MNWLSILLQANLYLVLFYGFYRLLLHNETFYNFNRTYLVGTTLLAFLIPLCHSDLVSSWIKSWFITEQIQETYTVMMQPAIVLWEQPIQPEYTWSNSIQWVYLIGIALFSIRLIINLLRIKINLNSPEKTEKLKAFSFFKKIFIDKNLPNHQTILAHEKVHANQFHTADVLLLEIFAIVCWFNPVVYFYKTAIKHIHEFIADEIASKNEPSKAAYAMLLFSQEFGVKPLELTNSFYNKSLLKQRIIMLNKPRSRRTALLKYGLSVPLFILMLIISSATVAENNAIKKVETLVKTGINELGQPKPKTVTKNEPSTVKGEIFDNVEQNPEFPNGIKAMYEWLGKHIKYPKSAIKDKIEGKVFVRFVVKKDGKVADVVILKGISPDCDNEVIRVVKAMPTWKSGKQRGKPVNVYFTMPIVYQLGEDKKLGTTIHKSDNASEFASVTSNRIDEAIITASSTKPETDIPPIGIHFDNSTKNELVVHSRTKNGETTLVHPLCVVDGEIKGDFDSQKIKPEEIESVSVLKDESATAAYGEKGKNGVVIITTKVGATKKH